MKRLFRCPPRDSYASGERAQLEVIGEVYFRFILPLVPKKEQVLPDIFITEPHCRSIKPKHDKPPVTNLLYWEQQANSPTVLRTKLMGCIQMLCNYQEIRAERKSSHYANDPVALVCEYLKDSFAGLAKVEVYDNKLIDDLLRYQGFIKGLIDKDVFPSRVSSHGKITMVATLVQLKEVIRDEILPFIKAELENRPAIELYCDLENLLRSILKSGFTFLFTLRKAKMTLEYFMLDENLLDNILANTSVHTGKLYTHNQTTLKQLACSGDFRFALFGSQRRSNLRGMNKDPLALSFIKISRYLEGLIKIRKHVVDHGLAYTIVHQRDTFFELHESIGKVIDELLQGTQSQLKMYQADIFSRMCGESDEREDLKPRFENLLSAKFYLKNLKQCREDFLSKLNQISRHFLNQDYNSEFITKPRETVNQLHDLVQMVCINVDKLETELYGLEQSDSDSSKLLPVPASSSSSP